MRLTNKQMGINRTYIRKHNVLWNVWEYKGIFWTSRELAIKAYLKDKKK